MKQSLLTVVVVVLASMPTATALSQTDVDALFTEATADFQAERYEAALIKLRRIYAEEPDAVIRYNIARCFEELELWDDARTHFRAVLKMNGLPEDLRTEARDRLQRLPDDRVAETPQDQPPDDEEPGGETKIKAPADPMPPATSIVLRAHAGVTDPELVSDFGIAPRLGLEVGYIPNVDIGGFVRPLQLAVDATWSAQSTSGDVAGIDWTLTQQSLTVDVTLGFRFSPVEQTGMQLFAGPRTLLTSSELDSVGAATTEEDTAFGVVAGVGLDIPVGPGNVAFHLSWAFVPIEQELAGETDLQQLDLALGYRLRL